MAYHEAFGIVMRWATINGAHALQMDDELGSLERGKQPGIVLINISDQSNLVRREYYELLSCNAHLRRTSPYFLQYRQCFQCTKILYMQP
jgi:cytosine/adenosine deaminase-related metal-dependent hydrolase